MTHQHVPVKHPQVGATYIFIRENVHLQGKLLNITTDSYVVDDEEFGRTTISKSSVRRILMKKELQDNEEG